MIRTEHHRRASLLDAAIAEIGERRSTNVTVGQIARRAGVSSALAHHYFGTKQQILLGAMRRILGAYGREVRRELAAATSARDRVRGIVRASFAPDNFEPDVIRAWLLLYLTAQSEPQAARLLRVYRARLQSNLRHALRPLVGADACVEAAETMAALIDGLYIRSALDGDAVAGAAPVDVALSVLARLTGPAA